MTLFMLYLNPPYNDNIIQKLVKKIFVFRLAVLLHQPPLALNLFAITLLKLTTAMFFCLFLSLWVSIFIFRGSQWLYF